MIPYWCNKFLPNLALHKNKKGTLAFIAAKVTHVKTQQKLILRTQK